MPQKYYVSDIAGKLKGKAAIRMFNKFPELRRRYWENHFWSRGYYVNTAEENESMTKEYIKNQDKFDYYKLKNYLSKEILYRNKQTTAFCGSC